MAFSKGSLFSFKLQLPPVSVGRFQNYFQVLVGSLKFCKILKRNLPILWKKDGRDFSCSNDSDGDNRCKIRPLQVQTSELLAAFNELWQPVAITFILQFAAFRTFV